MKDINVLPKHITLKEDSVVSESVDTADMLITIRLIKRFSKVKIIKTL